VSTPTRWAIENSEGHSHQYVERFRRLAADGADLAGEARLIDAMVGRSARILDAGCGSGRVGAELHARGHDVVGVDADPVLIGAAIADHPGPQWLVADLATLSLAAVGEGQPFDAAVLAGNVLAFVAPGSEHAVLARIAEHLNADGIVVAGFALDRGYGVTDLDDHADAAGLTIEHRFSTWDLRPFTADSSFAVSVFRRISRPALRPPGTSPSTNRPNIR
jgi:SAM-dependent methyltransferase